MPTDMISGTDLITTVKARLDGSRSIAELVESRNLVAISTIGKMVVQDVGKRFQQIAGLKPGSASIRIQAMITEITQRLVSGETNTNASAPGDNTSFQVMRLYP